MIRRSFYPGFLSCIFIAATAGSAMAQTALDSTAATGDFGRGSDYTRQGGGGVIHDNRAYDRSLDLGAWSVDTLPTSTRNYLGNSGGLAPTTTQLMAPSSVNNNPIPSGTFNLGFGQGYSQPYTGPYTTPFGSGFGGGFGIPVTGTGSVEIDIMGAGYNTGFTYSQPSEYMQAMKQEGMPSTLNEQGGADDKVAGF